MARPYYTHVAASASGLKGGSPSSKERQFLGIGVRLDLDFSKAGCCALVLLELGRAALRRVLFDFLYRVLSFASFIMRDAERGLAM